mmetsp:Transcript_32893/g.84045  ORF Transcript_32893/g.84045 Transcript_32893/m.84045 type:complete len:327 (+) Transcript_32893:1135-2115(+)
MVRLFAQCFARLAAVLAAPLRLQRPPGRRPRWAAVGSRAPGRQVHQAAAAPPTSPPPAPLSPPPPGLWRRFCSPVPEVPPAAPHAQSCRLPPQSLQAPSAPQLPPTPPLRLAPGWTEVRAGQEHRPQPVAAAGHPPPRARREGTWSWWARRGRGESPSAPWPPAAPPPLPQPGPGRRCRCRCRCHCRCCCCASMRVAPESRRQPISARYLPAWAWPVPRRFRGARRICQRPRRGARPHAARRRTRPTASPRAPQVRLPMARLPPGAGQPAHDRRLAPPAPAAAAAPASPWLPPAPQSPPLRAPWRRHEPPRNHPESPESAAAPAPT